MCLTLHLDKTIMNHSELEEYMWHNASDPPMHVHVHVPVAPTPQGLEGLRSKTQLDTTPSQHNHDPTPTMKNTHEWNASDTRIL